MFDNGEPRILTDSALNEMLLLVRYKLCKEDRLACLEKIESNVIRLMEIVENAPGDDTCEMPQECYEPVDWTRTKESE